MVQDSGRPKGSALLSAIVFWAAVIVPAEAQHLFDSQRDFVIDRSCAAYRSIRKKTEPTPMTVGRRYVARGVNKRNDPTHAFIRVGRQSKWVALACGRFTVDGAAIPADPTPADPAGTRTCLPFFDDLTNPVAVGVGGVVDVTPPPPPQNDFDKAITRTCGQAGKPVSRAAFKALFTNHPAILARIRTFTAGRVFAHRPIPRSMAAYLRDLTDAWFAAHAFDHIFCGEPSPQADGNRIGGLHFHGRYLQLQESGEACRIDNLHEYEVKPGVIYTMGVRMKNAYGHMISDWRKGYGLTLSGEDLFKLVTRAFAENPARSRKSRGCWLSVRDDGHRFTAMFVRRAKGIRTFFPDATPPHPNNRQTPDCTAAINPGSR